MQRLLLLLGMQRALNRAAVVVGGGVAIAVVGRVDSLAVAVVWLVLVLLSTRSHEIDGRKPQQQQQWSVCTRYY